MFRTVPLSIIRSTAVKQAVHDTRGYVFVSFYKSDKHLVYVEICLD